VLSDGMGVKRTAKSLAHGCRNRRAALLDLRQSRGRGDRRGSTQLEQFHKTPFHRVHSGESKYFQVRRRKSRSTWHGCDSNAVWINGTKLSVGTSATAGLSASGGTCCSSLGNHSLVAEQVRRGILTSAEAKKGHAERAAACAGRAAEIEVDAEEHNAFSARCAAALLHGLTRMVTEPKSGTLQVESDLQGGGKSS